MLRELQTDFRFGTYFVDFIEYRGQAVFTLFRGYGGEGSHLFGLQNVIRFLIRKRRAAWTEMFRKRLAERHRDSEQQSTVEPNVSKVDFPRHITGSI